MPFRLSFSSSPFHLFHASSCHPNRIAVCLVPSDRDGSSLFFILSRLPSIPRNLCALQVPTVITIPETEVTRSSVIRFEMCQSANHEDFSIEQIDIQYFADSVAATGNLIVGP